MKRIGVVVTSIALAMAPALAADKTIPLATMTCKQFVDSPKDTIGVILTWMMGYLQDEDEPAELDFSKMEDLGKKLGTYCGQNPTHGVMRALDKVSDADDDTEVLKSVVSDRCTFRRERSAPRTSLPGKRSGATTRSCGRKMRSS